MYSTDHGRRKHEAEAGAEPAWAAEGYGGGGTGARAPLVQVRNGEITSGNFGGIFPSSQLFYKMSWNSDVNFPERNHWSWLLVIQEEEARQEHHHGRGGGAVGVPRRLLGCPQGRQLGRQDRRGGQAVVAEGASVGILSQVVWTKWFTIYVKEGREGTIIIIWVSKNSPFWTEFLPPWIREPP